MPCLRTMIDAVLVPLYDTLCFSARFGDTLRSFLPVRGTSLTCPPFLCLLTYLMF